MWQSELQDHILIPPASPTGPRSIIVLSLLLGRKTNVLIRTNVISDREGRHSSFYSSPNILTIASMKTFQILIILFICKYVLFLQF